MGRCCPTGSSCSSCPSWSFRQHAPTSRRRPSHSNSPLTWPGLVVANVIPVLEFIEEPADPRMMNRIDRGVGNQVLRGGVGASRRAIDQDVIPRLIAVWLSLILQVPLRIRLTAVISADHHTSVAVSSVADKLPRFEGRSVAGVSAIELNHLYRAP